MRDYAILCETTRDHARTRETMRYFREYAELHDAMRDCDAIRYRAILCEISGDCLDAASPHANPPVARRHRSKSFINIIEDRPLNLQLVRRLWALDRERGAKSEKQQALDVATSNCTEPMCLQLVFIWFKCTQST